MKYQECDQIANDLFVGARQASKALGAECKLDYQIGELLVEEVERSQRSSRKLRDTIELVLKRHRLGYVEEEGYRRALTKIIGRRKGAAREERRQRDAATDFPRGQEM